jgi:nitronate monooxygenase
MPLPASLQGRLKVPVIAAPMFLVSNPKLVIETCKAGALGTFPALNQRSSEGYAAWLEEIEAALTPADAPFGVNLIVHKTNPRLGADLEVTAKHKVPVIITSLGAVKDVVDTVHSYGGLVFHDVTNMRFAEKAIEAGVDGLVPVCAGAGGHAGAVSPFALVEELRRAFPGTCIALSGCISNGAQVAAAQAMGADLAYLGTRFIATTEAEAEPGYKEMLLESTSVDVFYTPKVSGIPANFLLPSIRANGLDPETMEAKSHIDMGEELSERKAWKTIWSAGQGVGGVRDVIPVAALVQRLSAEYRAALQEAQARLQAMA